MFEWMFGSKPAPRSGPSEYVARLEDGTRETLDAETDEQAWSAAEAWALARQWRPDRTLMVVTIQRDGADIGTCKIEIDSGRTAGAECAPGARANPDRAARPDVSTVGAYGILTTAYWTGDADQRAAVRDIADTYEWSTPLTDPYSAASVALREIQSLLSDNGFSMHDGAKKTMMAALESAAATPRSTGY